MKFGRRFFVFLVAVACLGLAIAGSALAQEVDLALSTTVSPASPAAGSPLTFLHAVSFVSGSRADNVTVTDMLPPGTTFHPEGSDSRCSVDTCGTTVACALGSISSSTSVAVAVTPAAEGLLTNVAGVAADPYDPVMANNTSVTQSTVGSALTYCVRGRITLDGGGLAGVIVTAGSMSGTTDANGDYSICGLTSGPYSVAPALNGYAFSPGSRNVTVSGADIAGVDFTATATAPGTHSISGKVALDGSGVAGVTVTAGSASATTDANGDYTIPGLVDGSYTVTPALACHGFSPTSQSVTVSGANVIGVNFATTTVTYSIGGLVMANSGGLAGVTVTAGSASVTTNANGAYTIPGLAHGTYNVTPTLAGYTFTPTSIPRSVCAANVSAVNFEATADNFHISGSVTLGGSGLVGVTVTAGSASATTNANGVYTISGLTRGTYAVTPALTGFTFSPSSSPQTISGVDLTGVNFAATTTGYSISGAITLGGSGLAGVAVTAGSASATTNASGAYTIAGLTNGTYAVTPTLAGYVFSPASSPQTIAGASKTGVNFTAAVAYSISGTITLGGSGLSGVTVTAGAASVTTNASGAYTIPGLPSGGYTVTPTLAGYIFSPPHRPVAINVTNVTSVDFAAYVPHSISGTITLGGSGLSGVTVTAGAASVTTNASGAYTISGLIGGQYAVTPALAGYSFSPSSSLKTIGSTDLTGVNFTATLITSSISGTVTLGGSGLAGVTVTAGSASATTNASGAYTISGLANGTYAVTPTLVPYAFSPSSSSQTVNGADLAAVDFTAAVTYSIGGLVTMSGSGAGLAGVTVSAGGLSATTNALGAYSIRLPNGTYNVTPTLAGYTFSPTNLVKSINGGNVGAVNFSAAGPN